MARYIYQTNDKKEFEYAFKGIDYLLSLWDMDQWLRKEIKYNYEKLSEEQRDVLDVARKELWDIMERHGVSLEDLE